MEQIIALKKCSSFSTDKWDKAFGSVTGPSVRLLDALTSTTVSGYDALLCIIGLWKNPNA